MAFPESPRITINVEAFEKGKCRGRQREVEGKSQMKFSEFCSVAYPILKCICHNQCELFDFLVLNCISEDQEKLKDELSGLSAKTKKNLVAGKSSFGNVASQIFGHFDDTEFLERIDDEISAGSVTAFLPRIQAVIADITESNFSEKLGEKLCETVRDEACSYRKKKCLDKIEFENGEPKTDLGMISISVDLELINALERLLESPGENMVKLNLTALRIDKKIDPSTDSLLSKKVKSYVSEYFPTMNEFIHDKDGVSEKSFEKLAVTMRAVYLEANEKTGDKNRIFDSVVDIMQGMTGCSRIVAEIIVSYFVQDCEVFDEISE